MKGLLRRLLRATHLTRVRGKQSRNSTQSLPTTRELLAAFSLDEDVPCSGCGYNVRGLPTSKQTNCPECGKSTVPSRIYFLSSRTGRPVDTFIFIEDALRWFQESRAASATARFSSLQVCHAVYGYALEQAGDPDSARDLLEGWEIRRSEDVGALIYSMVEVGLFGVEPDDSPDLFDGLPGISEIGPNWPNSMSQDQQ